MFWTIFFAVLLALIVYNIFKNPELLELLWTIFWKILKRVFIGWFCLLLIWWIIYLIDNHWEDILWILVVIWFFVGAWLLVAGYNFLKLYLIYKKRMRLGLIKEWVKYSSFLDEKFEKEWYDNLTKKQREIEDKRASKWPKIMFYCLIAIPVLLLAVIVIFFLVEAIKEFL